jgi:hypothetical protein
MESAVKVVRLIQVAMLVSIVILVFIGERMAPTPQPASDPTVFYVLSLASITIIGVILVVRRTLVLQSANALRGRPNDAATLRRWQAGHIATYALSETLALFALLLRFLGFNLSQVAPLYLAGFILILFFGPRQPSREAV